MGIKRCLLVTLALILLLGCVCVPVYAHEIPDERQEGSITVRMLYNNKPVGGGKLAAYHVGEIWEDDGNYSFVFTPAFENCGLTLDDLKDSNLAKSLELYATNPKNKITPDHKADIGKTGSSKGIAWFRPVELGLYLIVQTQAASGFQAASSFLVGVPTWGKTESGGEGYIYDVTANPKLPLKPRPSTPGTPPKPHGPKLPQTGQLNWPVPALTVIGLAVFSCGWVLGFGKKKRKG